MFTMPLENEAQLLSLIKITRKRSRIYMMLSLLRLKSEWAHLIMFFRKVGAKLSSFFHPQLNGDSFNQKRGLNNLSVSFSSRPKKANASDKSHLKT